MRSWHLHACSGCDYSLFLISCFLSPHFLHGACCTRRAPSAHFLLKFITFSKSVTLSYFDTPLSSLELMRTRLQLQLISAVFNKFATNTKHAGNVVSRATVYRNLTGLYPTHACREYRNVLKILERECGYSEYNVPQLEHVSNFLRSTYKIYVVSEKNLISYIKQFGVCSCVSFAFVFLCSSMNLASPLRTIHLLTDVLMLDCSSLTFSNHDCITRRRR